MNELKPKTVAVLGAGIQGVLVALALCKAGWRVSLIDRASQPLLGASLRGEGKIHLGYVYGNEPGRETAQKMIEGALSFKRIIDDLVPKSIDWQTVISEPFNYAILEDSMVSPEKLFEHYCWVDDTVSEYLKQGEDYVGYQKFNRVQKVSDPVKIGYSGDVVAAFKTSERAITPYLLRNALLEAVKEANMHFYPNYFVRSVERDFIGFTVSASKIDLAEKHFRADAVVNCLWDGRLAVDATMNLKPGRECLYRLKCAVNARLDEQSKHSLTTTFVLGPYGDVVRRGNGNLYLSWYPICLNGLSKGLEPPANWFDQLNDPEYMNNQVDIAKDTIAALSKRIEALRGARIESVSGGVIVAWGNSDINNPDSELHQRYDIGVHDYDGYISVDTGKLTTAPMFANQVAALLGKGKPFSA